MEGPPGEGAVFRGDNGSEAEVLLVDPSSMPSPRPGLPRWTLLGWTLGLREALEGALEEASPEQRTAGRC